MKKKEKKNEIKKTKMEDDFEEFEKSINNNNSIVDDFELSDLINSNQNNSISNKSNIKKRKIHNPKKKIKTNTKEEVNTNTDEIYQIADSNIQAYILEKIMEKIGTDNEDDTESSLLLDESKESLTLLR